MTPADVISEVRNMVSDAVAPYRYSDVLLLQLVNNVARRMAVLRPDIFVTTALVPTVPNSSYQELPVGATRLIDLLYVDGGNALEEVDILSFNTADVGWSTDPAGIPNKFMRTPKSFRGYILYPRPTAGVQILAQYTEPPPSYGLSDPLDPIPDAYTSILIDGVVQLVSSIDDEHVLSGRAELFERMFLNSLRSTYEIDRFLDGGGMPQMSQNRGEPQ